MWISPRHRGKGCGFDIAAWLKQGLGPISGCDLDNIASSRFLIKAGFASDQQLLAVETRQN